MASGRVCADVHGQNMDRRQEEESARSPSINVLPDCCLYIILDYLSIGDRLILRAVCRRWYSLCTCSLKDTTVLHVTKSTYPSIWTKEESTVSRLTTLLVNFIQHFGSDIRTLKFQPYCFLVLEDFVEALQKHCPKIVEVHMSSVFIAADIRSYLLSLAPTLRSLKIKECVFFDESCRDGIQNVLPRLVNLTTLQISCFYRTESMLGINQLDALNSSLTWLDVSGMIWLEEFQLVNILKSVPNLLVLHISSLTPVVRNLTILTISMMKHLRELHMNEFATDEVDLAPLADVRSLETLCLINNDSASEGTIEKIRRGCKNLRIFQTTNERPDS